MRRFGRFFKQSCTSISIILLLFLLIYDQSVFTSYTNAIDSASISPNPSVYITDYQGEEFIVEIRISEVEYLQRCEFTISYNSSLLDVVDVIRGSFFPSHTTFTFEEDEHLGLIDINLTVSEGFEPLSGSGILAQLTFEVTNAPTDYPWSTMEFTRIRLYNAFLEVIDHKSVGAVFFWRSIQADESEEERSIDLCTQRGGEGLNKPSGGFTRGEVVHLFSYVSYENWPAQRVLVTFQGINPLNQTVFLFVNETNEEGYAYANFRIPDLSESVGTWTVVSSVDVACEIIWDIVTFQVEDHYIGGISFPIDINLKQYLLLHIVLITILVARTNMGKRKIFY